MAPINLRGSFLVVLLVNLLLLWVLFACKLIALCLIFLHVVIQTCTCFFFGIPPFEELQDPSSSPRREEVGRRTLEAYGGFLLPFFCRARFRLFTRQFLVFVDKPQKLSLTSLQTPQEWKNRTLLDEGSTSDEVIPPEDII